MPFVRAAMNAAEREAERDRPAAQQGTAEGGLYASEAASVGAARKNSYSAMERNRDARVTSRFRFLAAISMAALKTVRSPTKTTCFEARVAAV